MVEVDGRVAGLARRINVDDLYVFADWPGLEIALPRHPYGRDAHIEHRRICLLSWIVGIDPQTAEWRLGNLRLEGKLGEKPGHPLPGRGGLGVWRLGLL